MGQEAHYARATRLADFNIWFGVPVVALTTLVATSVFATLQKDVRIELRIAVGIISALAAVLASLQTFLGSRSEPKSIACRRSCGRPYVVRSTNAFPSIPIPRRSRRSEEYLDDLRRRMDEVSAQSLELGERYMTDARRKLSARVGDERVSVASSERTGQDTGAEPT